MKTITATVSRVDKFYGSCGYVGKNLSVYFSDVTKEQIKEMLEKYETVIIRSKC